MGDTKWIKVPGAGQFRGEGQWHRIEEVSCSEEDWRWNHETGYLPTAEQAEKPE